MIGDNLALRHHTLGRRTAWNPEDIVRPERALKLFRRNDLVESVGVTRSLKAPNGLVGAGRWSHDAPGFGGRRLAAAKIFRCFEFPAAGGVRYAS